MVLQAFIDDSYKDGVYVLAGYIANAKNWAAFSRDWEELLPFGVHDSKGEYHFKMSEMAQSDERMRRVPAFYKVIERHLSLAVSCIVLREDYEKAKLRVSPKNRMRDWHRFDNLFSLTFRFLIDTFQSGRDEFFEKGILSKSPIDFYFDEQSEKGPIIAAWDEYLEAHGEIRPFYGASPRFENDKQFLPLQAPDFWAWWVRRWYQEGDFDQKMNVMNFGKWKGATDRLWKINVWVNEDEIVSALLGVQLS